MPVKINWPAVGGVILPNVGGIAGGFITKRAISSWYVTLKRPSWNPPNWVFGPMWTTLYCSMGYASYLVYRDGGGFNGPARIPLIIYGTNIFFNWAWTPIFFGARKIDLALYEMQLVNATAIATGYFFYQINPVAGFLIIPYCLWMGLATALTYTIWRDNKESPKIKEIKDN